MMVHIESLVSCLQVRDMAILRHKQHQQKQLRSRQRKNYEHLLTRSVSSTRSTFLFMLSPSLSPQSTTLQRSSVSYCGYDSSHMATIPPDDLHGHLSQEGNKVSTFPVFTYSSLIP